MNTKKREKKFRINQSLTIGSPDAETDDLLFDAFVDNKSLKQILDTRNQKSILLGRTGSGKSAIIRYVEKNSHEVVCIEPEALSLRFLSNSTILKYFRELGVNLSLFFKVLWKHVFIVELLKMYFKDDFNKSKTRRWLDSVRDGLLRNIGKSDPKKEKALSYLENWTDKFWNDTEYRIRELEKNINQKFAASIGMSVESANSLTSLHKEVSGKSITDVKHKAESIIHEVQSKELLEIINMLKNDLFTDHQRKIYIVIDDLDKEWVETTIRYELIDTMIDVVKEFRKFEGVQIVISLRENLSELLLLGKKHLGSQREKYRPLYANLEWSSDDLKTLIDKRMKIVTENNLDVKSAFYKMRKTNKTGIDYVLDRTYKRPRDVISFINHAFENSKSKSHLTKDIIHKAEIPYSQERFEALEDEWRENFGEIYLVSKFLNGRENGFKLKSLNENDFEDVYLDDEIDKKTKGKLLEAIKLWKSDQIKFISFCKKIIYILYHIGVIGIKRGVSHPVVYFYDPITIKREEISTNNSYFVHPSLYSYFKINTLEQLPED